MSVTYAGVGGVNFYSLYNSHVILYTSRNTTWNANILCVTEGSATTYKNSGGAILKISVSIHQIPVTKPRPFLNIPANYLCNTFGWGGGVLSKTAFRMSPRT